MNSTSTFLVWFAPMKYQLELSESAVSIYFALI